MGVTHEQMSASFGVTVLSPEESAVALLGTFDNVSREKHSMSCSPILAVHTHGLFLDGHFLSYDGSELQW